MIKVLRFVAPAVIAVALGPLFAGLAVSLFAITNGLFDPANSLEIHEYVTMFGLYIGFAYFLGSKIALLTGILIATWVIWRPLNLIMVVAAALVVTSAFMAAGALGFLGLVEQTNARSNFFFTLMLAVIAAVGCWVMIRGLVKSPSAHDQP